MTRGTSHERVFGAPDEPSGPPPLGCFARALVVDDHPVVRQLLCIAIERWGAQVAAAADVREALSMLTPVPDLVVVDVRLPDGSGATVAAEAARLVPRPLVVGISGSATAREAFDLSQAGVRAYVTKPFSSQDLATIIGRALVEHEIEELRAGRVRPVSYLTSAALDEAVGAFAQNHGLTARQRGVVASLVRGTPREELARVLGMSENTCKKHVRGVLARCGVKRTTEIQALVLARREPPGEPWNRS